MAQRKTTRADAPPSINTAVVSETAVSSLATDPAPTVKVNKAHLAEVKTALDDILKKHLVDQAFTPSRLHPTVHLSLGYASVLISLGAMLNCMRMSFEESKPALWIAVVSYAGFQGALWAWKRWVERGEVFRGRRRRIVKRIETDLIEIYTSTSLMPPPSTAISVSPNSRPPSPVSPMSSPSTLSSASSSTFLGPPPIQPHPHGPTYLIHLKLSTTSNNGKSLIHKARVVSGKPVGEVVDEDGGVEEGEVTRWISGLLSEAGLVGVEDENSENENEDGGFKNE